MGVGYRSDSWYFHHLDGLTAFYCFFPLPAFISFHDRVFSSNQSSYILHQKIHPCVPIDKSISSLTNRGKHSNTSHFPIAVLTMPLISPCCQAGAKSTHTNTIGRINLRYVVQPSHQYLQDFFKKPYHLQMRMASLAAVDIQFHSGFRSICFEHPVKCKSTRRSR